MRDLRGDTSIHDIEQLLNDMVFMGGDDEKFHRTMSALSLAAIALTLIKAVNHAIAMDKRLDEGPDSETLG